MPADPDTGPPSWDVVVLLGSDWAELEQYNSRWKQLVLAWGRRGRAASLTTVDYPSWRPERLLGRRADLVVQRTSWAPNVRSLGLTIPLYRQPTPADPWGWRRAGTALTTALGPSPQRLLVAATPLYTPLALAMPATRRVFDAVDDWREYSPAARCSGRVRRGYALARQCDRVSAVSSSLATVLHADFGLRPTVVENGVELRRPRQSGPVRLPERPFAVYVGSVDSRLDLSALADLRRELPDLPVVIAGPVDTDVRPELEALGLVLLGRLDSAWVPWLLDSAAVGLIPHRADGMAAGQSSLKLLEYLAAGLPVASTGVASGAFPRVTTVADGQSYAGTVGAALALGHLHGPDPDLRGRDWDAVADVTWTLYTGDRLASPASSR